MTQEHDAPAPPPAQSSMGWRELWLKEDWWAIWLGLGIILIAYVLFLQGSSLRWIAVTPARWSTLDELGADLAGNFPRYLAQFAFWLVTFSVALRALGYRPREFIPSFLFVYLVSVLIFSVGRWDQTTLVVTTTHISWAWFDQAGIPQSEQSVSIERFMPTPDGSRLDYTVTVTDPVNFTAPVTLTRYWLDLGETIVPYECDEGE